MSDSLWPHGLQRYHQASLSIITSQSLFKLMPIESVMPSNHLILCRPLLLLFSMSWRFASGGQSLGTSALPSVLPVNIQGRFPSGLTGLISWSKHSSGDPRQSLVKGKSMSVVWIVLLWPWDPQESSANHSSEASVLWRSAFFMVQLSHPYTTTGKNIALTMQTFASKVRSLLF